MSLSLKLELRDELARGIVEDDLDSGSTREGIRDCLLPDLRERASEAREDN
jgi:hypothetical protein